jgi:hypothetical protein
MRAGGQAPVRLREPAVDQRPLRISELRGEALDVEQDVGCRVAGGHGVRLELLDPDDRPGSAQRVEVLGGAFHRELVELEQPGEFRWSDRAAR